MANPQKDLDEGRLAPKNEGEGVEDKTAAPDNARAGAGPYGSARTDLSNASATGTPAREGDIDADGADQSAGGEYLDDSASDR